MKLIKFKEDHGGYKAGAFQYFNEPVAESLIQAGIAEDAYMDIDKNLKKPVTIDEEIKEAKPVVEAPPRDKMIRRPREKK